MIKGTPRYERHQGSRIRPRKRTAQALRKHQAGHHAFNYRIDWKRQQVDGLLIESAATRFDPGQTRFLDDRDPQPLHGQEIGQQRP
jgi:hypothetical protein